MKVASAVIYDNNKTLFFAIFNGGLKIVNVELESSYFVCGVYMVVRKYIYEGFLISCSSPEI